MDPERQSQESSQQVTETSHTLDRRQLLVRGAGLIAGMSVPAAFGR